jgi:hypothetical protein
MKCLMFSKVPNCHNIMCSPPQGKEICTVFRENMEVVINTAFTAMFCCYAEASNNHLNE